MIQIEINKKEHSIDDNATIEQLLETLSVSKKGTAVALNGNILPKNNWSSQLLNNEDKLTIIRATQGG